MAFAMWEFITVFALALILAYPLGHYLADVMQAKPMKSDRLFRWIEQPLYRTLRVRQIGMNWRQYLGAFVMSNVVLLAVSVVIFMTQAWLPLNPDHVPNMKWDLALLTAMLRALFLQSGKTQSKDKQHWQDINLGNYWLDLIRPLLRFFLPLAFVFSLLLTWQGVLVTLSVGPIAQNLDQSVEVKTQHIPLGPVAPMVVIKQLGSNGGGWYDPKVDFIGALGDDP